MIGAGYRNEIVPGINCGHRPVGVGRDAQLVTALALITDDTAYLIIRAVLGLFVGQPFIGQDACAKRLF